MFAVPVVDTDLSNNKHNRQLTESEWIQFDSFMNELSESIARVKSDTESPTPTFDATEKSTEGGDEKLDDQPITRSGVRSNEFPSNQPAFLDQQDSSTQEASAELKAINHSVINSLDQMMDLVNSTQHRVRLLARNNNGSEAFMFEGHSFTSESSTIRANAIIDAMKNKFSDLLAKVFGGLVGHCATVILDDIDKQTQFELHRPRVDLRARLADAHHSDSANPGIHPTTTFFSYVVPNDFASVNSHKIVAHHKPTL